MRKLTAILKGLGVVLIILFTQCNGSKQQTEHAHGDEHEHEHNHDRHQEHTNEDLVKLTDIQIASAGLNYGNFDTLNISGFVTANGILDLPPKNIATVSAPMGGFVREVEYLIGDYVEKGAILALLEHPDYIRIQEEYLQNLSNLEYLEAEWQRQRQLDSANVTAKKKFQQTESEYKSAKARKQALEKQLNYIGVSPEKVAKSEISSIITIRAPFSGYITQLSVHKGEFVQAEQQLYELIDNSHMHLELDVFEQDIYKVQIGQPIRYTVPGIGDYQYKGEVFLTGKSFDMHKKTVKVHGHLKGEHPDFIRGLYVEAHIYTGEKKVRALPEEAVVMDEGQNFIFVKSAKPTTHHEHDHAETGADSHAEEHGTIFKKILVKTGVKEQGYVEIEKAPKLLPEETIVTKGAYFLLAETKKGEAGHGHAH